MSKTVDFYFNVRGPSSYLAWAQLPKNCADASALLVYKPMLLEGVGQAIGNASLAAPKSRPLSGLRRRKRFAAVCFVHRPPM